MDYYFSRFSATSTERHERHEAWPSRQRSLLERFPVLVELMEPASRGKKILVVRRRYTCIFIVMGLLLYVLYLINRDSRRLSSNKRLIYCLIIFSVREFIILYACYVILMFV